MRGQVSALTREIIDRLYPVHIILDFSAEIDPNTAIGCGTKWVRIADGRALIASNSAHPVGWTGGTETVTLTEAQLPHLFGSIVSHSAEDGSRASQWYGTGGVFSASERFPGYISAPQAETDSATSIKNIVFSVGSDQPHSNMQPSRAVCRWERTA